MQTKQASFSDKSAMRQFSYYRQGNREVLQWAEEMGLISRSGYDWIINRNVK